MDCDANELFPSSPAGRFKEPVLRLSGLAPLALSTATPGSAFSARAPESSFLEGRFKDALAFVLAFAFAAALAAARAARLIRELLEVSTSGFWLRRRDPGAGSEAAGTLVAPFRGFFSGVRSCDKDY